MHIAVVGGGVLQFKLESQADFGTFSQEQFKQYHTNHKFLNIYRNAVIQSRWLYFVTSGGSLARLDLDKVRDETSARNLRCTKAEQLSSYCEDFDVGKRFIVVLKANGNLSMIKKADNKYEEVTSAKISHCEQTSISKYFPSSVTLLPNMDGCLTATYGSNDLNIIDLFAFSHKSYPPCIRWRQLIYLMSENSAAKIIPMSCSLSTGNRSLFAVDCKTDIHLLLANRTSISLLQSLAMNVSSAFVIAWQDTMLCVPLSQLVSYSGKVNIVKLNVY